MKNKKLYTVKSIYLKFLLIVLSHGFVILFLVYGFFQLHFNESLKVQFNKNVKNYLSYIAKDIGSPPDTNKMLVVASDYSMSIEYKSKKVNLNTPTIKADRPKLHLIRLLTGLSKNDSIIIINPDGSRFVFKGDFQNVLKPDPILFFTLLILIILLIGISFYIIKHILRPVKLLETGVKEVSKGNFSVNVPVVSYDELSSLTKAFNEMTAKIKEMILAREQLLLDVSHELRSPLTRIKLVLEMMKGSKDKESISADIKEIEMMVTEILESERLKKGNLKIDNYNLIELLKETSIMFKNTLPGFVFDSVPEELYLNFDYERMNTVFKNIFENAVKYSHNQSQPVLISVKESTDNVFIHIKDDGIGIPTEDIPYIFEPFYRTDRSRSRRTGGFGLGLSICKQIIEAHNGKISLQNNAGRGITITLVLNK